MKLLRLAMLATLLISFNKAGAATQTAVGSMLLIVVLVMAIFRIRELSPGNTTIELASTEVLDIQFEKPMGLGILERSN